jgi:hypothetical protein
VRALGILGEDTIPFHTVNLGAGACPSSGLDSTQTGFDGEFYFVVQTPGEYCLSIAENSSWGSGLWTEPLTYQSTAEVTITLNPGDDFIEQDFGWDDFNQSVFELEIIETVFCRFGPTMKHQPAAILDVGSRIPAIARNDDASWLMMHAGGLKCFKFNKDNPKMYMELPEFSPNDYPEPEPEIKEVKKPKPANCGQYQNIFACNSDPNCIWHIIPNALKMGGYCTTR